MTDIQDETKLLEEEKQTEPNNASEQAENKEQAAAPSAEEQLVAALALAEEYKNLLQRVQADFDNYRKRNVDSIRAARADGNNDVIAGLLPIADAIDRALTMIADDKSREGVALIQRQMDTLLSKFGVCEMKASGECFDPGLHNAILQIEDAENAGKVVEVLQKGYTRDGKVLRHAMVKVAK
jgi:molecular chaperone GrpE